MHFPRKLNLLAAGALAISLGLAGCGSSAKPDATTTTVAAPRLKVVATTPVLADFARVESGGLVDVYQVVKAGVDPTNYAPTAADITAIATADIVFKNGAGLEKWFDKTFQDSESHAIVVDTSVGVSIKKDASNVADPYIWNSPTNAKIMVGNMRAALVKADGTHADIYRSDESGYDSQIDQMRSNNLNSLATLNNDALVTNYSTLAYYAAEYGMTYVPSVFAVTLTTPPPATDLAKVVAAIKGANVKAIFVDPAASPTVAATVATAANVKVVQGATTLYGNTLGADGSDASTYLTMEKHNTDVIVRNLS